MTQGNEFHPYCWPEASAFTRTMRRIGEYLGLVEEHTWRVLTDDEIAKAFHETYERLAPEHGYQTRVESNKPWEFVPINNRELMRAVVAELVRAGVICRGAVRAACVCSRMPVTSGDR